MRDIDVRSALLCHLNHEHRDDQDTKIIEEMGVWSGAVRIDIAVINGKITGFELKSDRDTLERLPRQIEIYGKVFDELTLVVGPRHFERACDQLPPWWGIVLAEKIDGKLSLVTKRVAQQNLGQEPYLVAEMLSKIEAVCVMEEYGIAKGWRSKSLPDIHRHLSTELSFMQLNDAVRGCIKKRQLTNPAIGLA